MSFAANAVGFYLQLADEMSPALDAAETRYKNFVKNITLWSSKLNVTMQASMGTMAKHIDTATTSLGGSKLSAFNLKAAVLKNPASTKKIKIELDTVEIAKLTQGLTKALSRIFSKARLKFGQDKGGKGWTGSIINIPKYASGGVVGPPGDVRLRFKSTGGDDQIIAAQTGEVIIPKSSAKTFHADDLGYSTSEQKSTLNYFVAKMEGLLKQAVSYKTDKGLSNSGLLPEVDVAFKELSETVTESNDRALAPFETRLIQVANTLETLRSRLSAFADNISAATPPPPSGAPPAPPTTPPINPPIAIGGGSGGKGGGIKPPPTPAPTPGGGNPWTSATPPQPTGSQLWTSAINSRNMAARPPVIPPTFGEQMKKLLESLNDQQEALRGLKDGLDLGVVSTQQFMLAQHGLADTQKIVDAYVKKHDVATLRPYLTDLLHAKHATEELTEAGKREGGVFEKLLSHILGKSNFLAVNKALGSVQEGLTKVFAASHDVFSPGTEKLGDFVQNFNHLNKLMGMSRADLRKLKEQVLDDMKPLEGAFDPSEYSSAFQALRQAGITDVELLRKLTLASAALGKTTDTTETSAAGLFEELRQGSKLSADQMTDLSANIVAYAQTSGASAEGIVQHVQSSIGKLQAVMGDMTADQQARAYTNFAKFTATLESQAGKAGLVVSDLLSGAAGGDNAATVKLSQISGKSVSPEDARKMLETGEGLDTLLQNMSTNLASLPKDVLSTVAGDVFGLSPDEVAKLTQNTGALTAQLHDLDHVTVGVGKGSKFLLDNVKKNQTAFTTWTNKIATAVGSLKLFGIQGVDVLDFLREFNLQSLHSALFLAKEVVPQIGRLGAGLVSVAAKGYDWIKSSIGIGETAAKTAKDAAKLKEVLDVGDEIGSVTTAAGKFAPAVATIGTEAATATPMAFSLGKAIGELGIGIGTFLTEVGTGAGTGVAAFLAGIATGLAAFANPLVIGGTAVVVGALIGVAFAARVATPALEVLSNMFAQMNAGQILALGPGLALAGVGFTAFATGIAGGTTILTASIPVLAAFAGVLWLFTGTQAKTSGALASMIDAIAAAFTVDEGKMEQAIRSIRGSIDLIGALTQLSAMIEGDGIGRVVGLVFSTIDTALFGDPAKNMTAHAADIATTINTLGDSFSTINVEKLNKSGPTVKAVGDFIAGYSQIDTAVMQAAPNTGLFGAIADFFSGSDAANLLALQNKSGDIKKTIDVLVDDVSTWRASAKLSQAALVLKPIGDFMEAFGKVSASLAKGASIRTWESRSGFWSYISTFFLGDDLKKVIANIVPIRETVIKIVQGFSDASLIGLENAMPAAKRGLSVATDVMTSIDPLFAAAAKSADLANDLLVNRILGFFGANGPLDKINKVMPQMKTSIEGIVPHLGSIRVAMDQAQSGGVFAGLTSALTLTGDLTKLMGQVADFAKLVDDRKGDLAALKIAGPIAVGAMDAVANIANQMISKISPASGSLGNMAALGAQIHAMRDLIEEAAKLAMVVEQYETALHRLQSDRDAIAQAVSGTIVAVQQIMHNVNVPILSAAQLQHTVSMQIQGDVTASDEETHEQLDKIIDILSKQNNGPSSGNTPTAPTNATRAFGAGKVG